MRNRKSDPESGILWDKDYDSIEAEEPLRTFDFCHHNLTRQLSQDLKFLTRHDLMDFSLIVAETGDSIRVGIVDYLRSFTWDKALESTLKTYLPDDEKQTSQKPTILPAKEYSERFLSAISSYFHISYFDFTD